MIHEPRIIPLDGAARVGPASVSTSAMPGATGRASTLVVETTNFTDQMSIGFNGNGLRHSDQMRLVERFTRVDAGDHSVGGHDRRSEDLHEAVQDGAADPTAARLSRVRVRVS